MSKAAKRRILPAVRPAFKAGADLRDQVLDAASRLFAEGGYESVSMRRIAEIVGCSQMAMYRHFPDKDGLMQQLCIDLYEQFTLKLHRKFDQIEDPRERIREAVRQFITLSVKNPHHYRLAFLTPSADARQQQLRAKVADPALAYYRETLRLALPPRTPDSLITERLHQLLACQHGMAVLLITHPDVYKITKEAALHELEVVLDRLLTIR